jgi:hypothetical protein
METYVISWLCNNRGFFREMDWQIVRISRWNTTKSQILDDEEDFVLQYFYYPS